MKNHGDLGSVVQEGNDGGIGEAPHAKESRLGYTVELWHDQIIPYSLKLGGGTCTHK